MIYRSRLVGKEFNDGEVERLFAGTPPLFALKLLCSDFATDYNADDPKCIMVIDVNAAFLYGKTRRDIYIELPPQDPRPASREWIGQLMKAMYGTRDAPQVWYEEVRDLMINQGFTQSRTN